MAVPKKKVMEEQAAPVQVTENRRCPTVTKATMDAFKEALDEHNRVEGDAADFEFFLEFMVIEYTKIMRDETNKAKKEKEKSPKPGDKPHLVQHQQSA